MAGSSSTDRLSSGEYKYPFYQLACGLIKKALKILGIALLLGLLVYGTIAMTVARYVYIYEGENSGSYVLTRNPSTDMLQAGTQVVFDVSNNNGSPSLLDTAAGKFQLATLPPRTISAGVIEAGPTGNMVLDENNRVSINGKQTGLVFSDKNIPSWDDRHLDNQFIIKCLSGDCKPGVSYLVSAKAIAGEIDSKNSMKDIAAVIPDVKSEDNNQTTTNTTNSSNSNTTTGSTTSGNDSNSAYNANSSK